MKRNNEKVPGFDEIIFENRNKEYGAYQIRRKYLPTTIFSILGGAGLFTILVLLFAFTGNRDIRAEGPEPFWVIMVPDTTIIDPNTIKPEPPEDPPLETKVNIYAPPVIVEKLDSGDFGMLSVGELDSIPQKPVDEIIIPDTDPNLEVAPEPEEIPVVITEMPVFPGGQKALLKFIYDNIAYPEDAVANGVEGKVILRFVVSADGSVRKCEIVKGVDPLLDAEAMRVVSLIPDWKPGKNNGVPASVWFTVPVKFEIKRN